MTYRPQSFEEMVDDAAGSVKEGIAAGLTRMEVEFPPLPTQLDGYKGASDLFIDANVQLSLAGARRLAEAGRKVHLVMPDQGEYDRTYRMFKPAMGLMPAGVTLGHLKEGQGRQFSFEGLFNESGPDSAPAGQQADTYIVINATSVELTNVREYVNRMAPPESKKVVVLWNLELETLRGDLGLFGYPSKEMQLQFLCQFRPVFFLRLRDYSKSVNVAPFLVNYSGALFREFPGPWQVMLKQDNGEYACIAEDLTRYNLGELKMELQRAMGLNTEADGSVAQIFREGFKNSTWWEDEYETEASHEWRI